MAEGPRSRDPRPAAIMLEGALGEEDRRKMMSWVPPAVVDAYATMYWEANEFSDDDLRDWLDQQLIIGASRKGWRANQVVEVQKGEQMAKMSRERYLDPSYGTPPPDEGKPAKKGTWGG